MCECSSSPTFKENFIVHGIKNWFGRAYFGKWIASLVWSCCLSSKGDANLKIILFSYPFLNLVFDILEASFCLFLGPIISSLHLWGITILYIILYSFYFFKGRKERGGTPFLFCFPPFFTILSLHLVSQRFCSPQVLMKETLLLWWLPQYPFFFFFAHHPQLPRH